MWYTDLIKQRLKAIEIEYFYEDPEDDPDRAGDGYYFRGIGDGWSGSWDSREECVAMAWRDLKAEFHEIDWKIAAFNRCQAGGFRFVAQGKAENASLSYDPFAILWTTVTDGDMKPFTMLVVAPNARVAEDQVRRRLRGNAEFSVRRVKGGLKSVCRKLQVPHPRAEARAAARREPPLQPEATQLSLFDSETGAV